MANAESVSNWRVISSGNRRRICSCGHTEIDLYESSSGDSRLVRKTHVRSQGVCDPEPHKLSIADGGLALLGIYVTKKWVESIGDAADLIVTNEVNSSGVLLLADEKSFSVIFPFVQVEVLRKPDAITEKTDVLMQVKIPASEVTAILDFTEAQRKKMGF